jgi:hypothetical protein
VSDKKVDFDLNKLSQDELLKVYENIKSFLDYLEDNKIDLSEESEEANE